MLNISSDVIRGYNDTMILYLLWEKPSYGYEISKQIKQISGEKYVIKETTLYSAFTRHLRKMVTLLRLQTVTPQAENAGRITGLQMQDGTITG